MQGSRTLQRPDLEPIARISGVPLSPAPHRSYPLAVLASEHGIAFYVAAPLSTVDLATPDGASIPIEERSPKEVLEIGGLLLAPPGVGARHPAFDVTPARWVTGIVTEAGIVRPPYQESLAALFRLK